MSEGDDAVSLRLQLVEILSSPIAGLQLVEIAGDLIAEDARFNVWVYSRKARSTSAELWNLAALVRARTESIAEAWRACCSARGKERDSELGNMVKLLHVYRDELRKMRETGVIAYQDPGIPQELLEWD